MAGGLSLLIPDFSEVVSFLLGIVLGGIVVFGTLQHVQKPVEQQNDIERARKHVVTLDYARGHSRGDKASTLATMSNKPNHPLDKSHPIISENVSSDDPTSPPPISELQPQPQPQLIDLPLPLRTTLHQPHQSCRPWTSADFANRPVPRPQRPWKRQTHPAMHITDHVQYFPLLEDGSPDNEPQTTEEPANIEHAVTEVMQDSTEQQKWHRRRTLVFEPRFADPQSSLLPIASSPSMSASARQDAAVAESQNDIDK